jgi:transcriptional regulator with XRE-family HTH domain
VITGDQIRMARAALRLGIRELAALAKVAPMTVSRLETGRSGGHAETIRKIERALEKAGIEFINGDSPGVRIKAKRKP